MESATQAGYNSLRLAGMTRFDRVETEVFKAFAEVMASLDPEGGAEVRPHADGWLISGGRYAPPIQFFGHAGFEREITDAELAEVEQFFVQKGLTGQAFALRGVNDALYDALLAREWRVMPHQEVSRLRLGTQPLLYTPTDEVTTGVVGPAELDDLLQVGARCWLERDELSENDLLIGRSFYGIDFGKTYAAWVDGEMVGYSLVYVRDGIATLHGACTMTGARRRGVQQALIHARVEEAIRQGCEEVWVVGEIGGGTCRNAARMGFERVGVREMLLMPESVA